MDRAHAASLSDPAKNRRFRGPWTEPPRPKRWTPRPVGSSDQSGVVDQVVLRALAAASARTDRLERQAAILRSIGQHTAALRFAAIADLIRREVLA
jgi:hypothetical protein